MTGEEQEDFIECVYDLTNLMDHECFAGFVNRIAFDIGTEDFDRYMTHASSYMDENAIKLIELLYTETRSK